MITYSWKITALASYPEYEGEPNVVFSIYATYTGTEGQFSSGIDISQSLIINASQPFTPYADLTENQVLGWLLAALTPQQISQMQAQIATQIYADAQQSYIQLPLPWSN
jgi:hypothetical protein